MFFPDVPVKNFTIHYHLKLNKFFPYVKLAVEVDFKESISLEIRPARIHLVFVCVPIFNLIYSKDCVAVVKYCTLYCTGMDYNYCISN